MVDGGVPSPGVFEPARLIVAGYNARPHSREALLWAAADAVRQGARLLIVYAANYPGMMLGPGPGLLEPEPGALTAAEEVTARGVSEAVEAQPKVHVTGSTELTSPTQALIEASREADLLVIGTRGLGRVAGALLGSVAFAVAARAECPVIVVKADPTTRPVGPRHHVVVGTDGSPQSAAAVVFAAERAATASAALEIVTCTGEHPAVDADRARASAATVARSAADQVSSAYRDLVVTTRVEDAAAERILVDASVDAGMVVVGTRGRGAFPGLLLGSVSHAVIYGAHCPVAVVDGVR